MLNRVSLLNRVAGSAVWFHQCLTVAASDEEALNPCNVPLPPEAVSLARDLLRVVSNQLRHFALFLVVNPASAGRMARVSAGRMRVTGYGRQESGPFVILVSSRKPE